MLSFVRACLRPSFLPLLVIALLVGSIAAAPAAPAQPNPPWATATQNAGEILVSWNPAAGAQFYTVGWINRSEYQAMQTAGRDWLDAFHYATIPANYTAHTIKGLAAGADYFTIVGAQTSRFGGQKPSWSAWSNRVTTAGLPLPLGGYLSTGDTTKTPSGSTFTLDSVTPIPTINLGGTDYPPSAGLKYVKVCGTYYNSYGGSNWITIGYHYMLTTDAGVGFATGDDNSTTWLDVGGVPGGGTQGLSIIVWQRRSR